MNKKQHIYLKMKTLAEARRTVMDHFSGTAPLESESIPASEAVGRVTAQPVFAALSSPHFHAAAMDGIAVKAEATFGASEARPKELQVGGNAFYVNTGHVMPPETDAVIMMEHLNALDDVRLEITAPAFPWQYVRRIGEDIVATELLFPQNHRLTPYCIGALISGGVFSVPVKRRPRVLIIPTGSELVDWRKPGALEMAPGKVLESNTYVLGNLVEAAGGVFLHHEKVQDDPAAITAAIAAAVEGDADMVLTVGGSSAGSKDFTKDVVLNIGEVLVHGVTIMPGKPLLVGDVRRKPVFGIPGYPVSAIIAFEQFVQPLIRHLLGQPDVERDRVAVYPTRKIASKLGLEEFIRVKLGLVGDRVVATPLPRGAGSITSITEADGIIRVPDHIEGLKDDDLVEAELLRPMSAIRQTIVAVGSHDNSLDVLADQIKAGGTRMSLSSSHVGSMGGLMAIKKGACHVAGTHLLDTTDGSYNVSYLKKYLPDMDVQLINLVLRDQGLIVPRGNPKRINGIQDLTREDVRFINRQAGSGTRILLDYRLREMGLAPADVTGYDIEEYTHMSVAVAVLSGTVDVGLGIYAAARALGLDFIPVVTEQYDLAIPAMYVASPKIQYLLDIINSNAFKRRVEALGGYSMQKTGQLITS